MQMDLVVICRGTNKVWLRGIRSKKLIIDAFRDIINTINRDPRIATEVQLEKVTSDQAGAFRAKKWKRFIEKELQAKREFTPPYAHFHAGKIERWNKTVWRMVLTAVYGSRLKLRFWDQTLQWVEDALEYLSTSKNPDFKSPYELLYMA